MFAWLAAGCDPVVYQAQSVLHDDGALERAVLQPREDTPADALASPAWTDRTFVDGDKARAWQDQPLASLPVVPDDGKAPYVAAWGKFATVAESPDAFAHFPHQRRGKSASRLVREHRRDDFVLVSEHTWKETLTDIVDLPTIRRARAELADLLIDDFYAVFEKTYGHEFDGKPLRDWMKGPGREWFYDLTDVLISEGAKGSLRQRAALSGPDNPLLRGFRSVSAKYGLRLTGADGAPLKDEEQAQVMRRFLEAKFRDFVRRKNGAAIDESDVRRLMRDLGFDGEAPMPRLDPCQPPPWSEVGERHLQAKYGSAEKYQAKVELLVAQILGAYLSELVGPARTFRYVLDLPGFVTTTNGELESDRRVRWEFDAAAAYPFGHTMEARCLVPQLENQDVLFGRRPVATLPQALEFRRLIDGEDELQRLWEVLLAERSAAERKTAVKSAQRHAEETFAWFDRTLPTVKTDDPRHARLVRLRKLLEGAAP